MPIHQLIDRLLKFERRIRHVYQSLSERSEFPARVRAFWQDMAEEENRHRGYLEQTAGLLNFMQSPPSISEAALTSIDEMIAVAEAAVQ